MMSNQNDQLSEEVTTSNTGSTADTRNKLSYFCGTTDLPFASITIPQILRATVDMFPKKEALVFLEQDIRMSYEELENTVEELAAGIHTLDMVKGDRIGIWSPNRCEWVLIQFAAARLGLVLVNINPAYRLSELEYALNKVGCKAIVCAKSFKSSDYIGMLRKLAPELDSCEPGQLQSERLPQLRTVVVMDDDPGPGVFSFSQLSELKSPEDLSRMPDINKDLNPEDAINIQFTSGTTGQPKGATLSHFNIINNARFCTHLIDMTEKDRLAIPVPLYHCFGMAMGVLGVLSKGATMIFPGEAFNPAQTLDALEKEQCTAVYGVPTMFVAMLEDLEQNPRDLSSMRTGIMAGAPCPVEVMRRIYTEMNMPEVTICYGMTETSPVSFQGSTDDPIDKRCETIGQVHPHLEVKIIDQDGAIVPIGTKGELCTRGYAVMMGYWDDEARTRESIVDNWMHSGDLGIFDEEGYCSIVGRVKDMIIRGGENIYPREVEEFLIRNPKVNDVQIFGIPDEKYGEVVCAWVISKPGVVLDESELREFCQDQISHFKIPAHFRFVEEFPMTITGKPQKFVMRDKMVEILG